MDISIRLIRKTLYTLAVSFNPDVYLLPYYFKSKQNKLMTYYVIGWFFISLTLAIPVKGALQKAQDQVDGDRAKASKRAQRDKLRKSK